MSRQIEDINSMETLDCSIEFNDDALESVKNLIKERNDLADINDKNVDKINALTKKLETVESDLSKSLSKGKIETELIVLSNTAITLIDTIRNISEIYHFLDKQWFINFLDDLNGRSIDPDRE